MKKRLILMLFVLGFSAPAFAGFMISPNLFYSSSEATLNGSKSKSTTTLLDAHIGYSLGGFYLGGVYSSSSKGDPADTRTGYGVGLGYVMAGWFFRAGYLLSVERKPGGTTSKMTGTGILVDFGYQFSITSMFSLGPHLAYQNFTYTEQTVAGVESSTDLKTTDILPMVGLSFKF